MTVNQFGEKYYKLALHLHTTVSDGRKAPEDVAKGYKEAGYDAIALGNHEFDYTVSRLSELFELSEKGLYRYVLANADEVKFINERYTSGVMKARNRALVDGSDICVAYLSKSSGGTYQTVGMARRAGLSIINVYN